MADARWDVPQTEEGLQTLLLRLQESRSEGDETAVGWGLLSLAHLVKWVRSDNDEPPFQRAHTLTEDALAIFRRIGDERGLMAALRSTSMFLSPDEMESRQAEAMRLAEHLGDEKEIARVLSAKARSLSRIDKGEATKLARQALEIFLRLEEKHSAAVCLFGLALYEGDKKVKFEAACESARLYRESGDPKEAAHAAIVAVMYGEGLMSWPELEPIVQAGLQDAQLAGDRSSEATFYSHLAKIAAAKGESQEAEKYLHWQNELQESDGLTAEERHQQAIEMTEQMIEMSKRSGDKEAISMFEEELQRLKKLRFD
jgi:tetratricopeptide (TPR) repeat protein